jgi:hypothetical protein
MTKRGKFALFLNSRSQRSQTYPVREGLGTSTHHGYGQWSWRVKYVFPAKNACGSVITHTAFVTIRHGEAVDAELE